MLVKPEVGGSGVYCMGCARRRRPSSSGTTGEYADGIANIFAAHWGQWVVHCQISSPKYIQCDGAGGEEEGGDEAGDRGVVSPVLQIGEAVPGTGVVVVVEDEQGLLAAEGGLHLGDGLTEVGETESDVGAVNGWRARCAPCAWKPTRVSMGFPEFGLLPCKRTGSATRDVRRT